VPTYEYRCPKCSTEFERSQKITAKPGARCPKCGARAERLMSGGVGLVFKGSGFYITDYGRAGQKAASQERAGAEKAEKAEKTEKTTAPEKPASKTHRKKDH
jgi:putative FmdB family regulatory protein